MLSSTCAALTGPTRVMLTAPARRLRYSTATFVDRHTRCGVSSAQANTDYFCAAQYTMSNRAAPSRLLVEPRNLMSVGVGEQSGQLKAASAIRLPAAFVRPAW